MPRPLPSSFFNRPTVEVAHDLIGCFLVRAEKETPGHAAKVTRSMITETEAYDGPRDRACHASKGRTARTEIMFGPAGHAYIYFVYGIHWMLNIVTGPVGYPAAVLIRGVEGMKGPAILTKRLGITGALNRVRLGKAAGLWIEPRDSLFPVNSIKSSARIGIDYAGPVWSKKKWRFFIPSSF